MHLAGRSCLTIWEDYNPNWIKTKQTNDAFWWEMKTFFFSIFGFREKDALLGLCFVGFGNSSFYVYDIAGTLPFFYSYGDRIPKSIPSRLFAFIWTWVGIATTAVIMSSITAYLMNMVFQPARMLYGTRVSKLHVYSREITSFECFPKTEILTSIDIWFCPSSQRLQTQKNTSWDSDATLNWTQVRVLYSVVRSVVIVNHWLRSIESYTFLS